MRNAKCVTCTPHEKRTAKEVIYLISSKFKFEEEKILEVFIQQNINNGEAVEILIMPIRIE